jgi:hypothetical protein
VRKEYWQQVKEIDPNNLGFIDENVVYYWFQPRGIMHNFSWLLLMAKRVILSLVACFLIAMVFLGSGDAGASGLPTTSYKDSGSDIYPTRTVHNEECEDPEGCLSPRKEGEPSDPKFPEWWTSDWTMYRVFKDYKDYKLRPPYASPPDNLTPRDYEVSYGTTYYDSTYIPQDGDGTGAMKEYYKERCLPIFPRNNQYSCAFVSLGNKAYFLNYDQNPAQKPRICLFSSHNHPPRTDFIKHLPYNEQESKHVDDSLQAYSILVPPPPGEDAKTLFGYAFYKNPTPDSFNKTAEPYRHPQSFYFSGDRGNPPNAPLVSQNYTNFRMEKPDSTIWSEVDTLVKETPQINNCCLFNSVCQD